MDNHDEDEFIFVTLEECSSQATNTNSGDDGGDWWVLVLPPRTASHLPPSPPLSLPPPRLSHILETTTDALRSDNCSDEIYNKCEKKAKKEEEKNEEEDEETMGPDFEALCEHFENHCERENSIDPLALDSSELQNKMDIYLVDKRCGTNKKMDLLGNRARRRHAFMTWMHSYTRNALDTYI